MVIEDAMNGGVQVLAAGEAALAIQQSEPRLRAWTRLATTSWALYEGANDSLSDPRGDDEVRLLIDEYRYQALMLSVVRIHALFDRDDRSISFQSAYQLLRTTGTADQLIALYGASLPASLKNEAAIFIDQYYAAYSQINWEAHGRLSHLRNRGLAHIDKKEVERFITFGEVNAFIRIACALQRSISLIVSGTETHAEETMDSRRQETKAIWDEVLNVDPIKFRT